MEGEKVKNKLTERELNVISLVSQGFTNNEIADRLHISVHTVKAHLEAIYEKFSVNNRVQAAIKAIGIGMIDLQGLF